MGARIHVNTHTFCFCLQRKTNNKKTLSKTNGKDLDIKVER